MAFMYVLGDCFACGFPFMFNAEHVPSHRDEFGIRQPICRTCMEQVNAERAANGRELWSVHPNAYEPGGA